MERRGLCLPQLLRPRLAATLLNKAPQLRQEPLEPEAGQSSEKWR